ncbi:9808_t:CDS:2, partial [Ambispora gerdemannii]
FLRTSRFASSQSKGQRTDHTSSLQQTSFVQLIGVLPKSLHLALTKSVVKRGFNKNPIRWVQLR